MKPLFFCCLFFCCQGPLLAQDPIKSLQLGYHEFTTTTGSYASDKNGNTYYTGYYKGQLKVQNQVLATGRGLEDIFWVKLNKVGQVSSYKTFGTAQNDFAPDHALAMGNNGQMYFSASTTETMQYGSITINPYKNIYSTSHIVAIDTSGNVQWVKKTSLLVQKIVFANNIIHVLGIPHSFNGSVWVEETALPDSSVNNYFTHLMFDETGKLLGHKNIRVSSNEGMQFIDFKAFDAFQGNRLFYSLYVQSDTAIGFGKNTIRIPNQGGFGASKQIYIITDTAYHNIKYKIINPNGGQIHDEAIHPAPNDSIYSILSPTQYTGSLYLDGHSLYGDTSYVVVMDSSLTVRRKFALSSSRVGLHPTNGLKRRLPYHTILWVDGQLYYTGQYTGTNETPLKGMMVKDSLVTIIGNQKLTIDLNGSSRSFIAKSAVDGSSSKAVWYGDHWPYEVTDLKAAKLYPVNNTGLSFIQKINGYAYENVWNPFRFDTSLQQMEGAMRPAADMPDLPYMVGFFDDGSRIILGMAAGKTAFDTSNKELLSSGGRRDLFMVCICPDNSVVWYKRFHSTLQYHNIRKLEMHNNKAWFLVTYFNSANDSNFLKIDNQLFSTRNQTTLLATVDATGNVTVLNQQQPAYKDAWLWDFGFLSNGDLLVAGHGADPALMNFLPVPPSNAAYLMRLNSSGKLIDARALYSSEVPLGVHSLAVDSRDQFYLSTQSYNQGTGKIILHNVTARIDSLQISSNPSAGLTHGVIKMDWNDLQWHKKFTGSAMVSFGGMMGSTGTLFLHHNKPVLVATYYGNNQILSWESTQIATSYFNQSTAFIGLDTNGALLRHKVLPEMNYFRVKKNNQNQLLFSGTLRKAMHIDSIQIGYMGKGDALGIVFDSNFTAKKHFRIASEYGESMLDFDVFRDSITAFAYSAQTHPQLVTGRTNVLSEDMPENGYLGTLIKAAPVVTGLNDPLPQGNSLMVAPNPIVAKNMVLLALVTERLPSIASLYSSQGQFIASKSMELSPGQTVQQWKLPRNLVPGIYYVVVYNKKWTITRSLIIQ